MEGEGPAMNVRINRATLGKLVIAAAAYSADTFTYLQGLPERDLLLEEALIQIGASVMVTRPLLSPSDRAMVDSLLAKSTTPPSEPHVSQDVVPE